MRMQIQSLKRRAIFFHSGVCFVLTSLAPKRSRICDTCSLSRPFSAQAGSMPSGPSSLVALTDSAGGGDGGGGGTEAGWVSP